MRLTSFFQVEHVFSKEPNYDATSYGFANFNYDYEKNRLGNLGLLEKSLNIGLGNLPPINKAGGYLIDKYRNKSLAGGIKKDILIKRTLTIDEKQSLTFVLHVLN